MSSSHAPTTYLFVDGSNLYGSQYELVGPYQYLDFSLFIQEIEKNLHIKYQKIFIYASFTPHDNQSVLKPYIVNELKFYKSTYGLTNSTLIKGHRSLTSGKEKGVDVSLASDMVAFAYENYYNEVHILTGDADFDHALQIIKTKGKSVRVLCIHNRIAYPLAYHYPTSVLVLTDKNLSKTTSTKKPSLEWVKLNPVYKDTGYVKQHSIKKIIKSQKSKKARLAKASRAT